MDNAMALAHVMGPVYLLVGLSILFYAKSWNHLIRKWADDHFSLFTIEFMYVILGLISINMYNVWEWNVWLLVTVTGWGLLVKGVFYFLFPGETIKKMLMWKGQMNTLYIGGVVGLVIGAVLTYYSYYA